MDQLNKKQVIEAFRIWYGNYKQFEIDKKVIPFLSGDIHETTGGWLRSARTALFLSTGQMAKRLNINRSAYSKFERNEEAGAITIATLSKLANAMDCELVYAIRPKSRLKFSEKFGKSFIVNRAYMLG